MHYLTYFSLFFLALTVSVNCHENDFYSSLREFYNEQSEHYEELVLKTSYIGPIWIKSHIDRLEHGQKRLLDLGCANGMIAEIVKEFRPDYLFDGVDYSTGMIEVCLKKNIYENAILADLSEGLPHKCNAYRYDTVLATGCLEFISQHENLFKEIHSVLNPGGQFWLTVQAAVNENESLNDSLLGIKSYYTEEIKNLLRITGYKVIEFELCQTAYFSSQQQVATPYYLIIAEKS